MLRLSSSHGVILDTQANCLMYDLAILFSVVSQEYATRVNDFDVILGNSAILKCEVPSFITDWVSVIHWLDDNGHEFYQNAPGNYFVRTTAQCSVGSNLNIPNLKHPELQHDRTSKFPNLCSTHGTSRNISPFSNVRPPKTELRTLFDPTLTTIHKQTGDTQVARRASMSLRSFICFSGFSRLLDQGQ